MAINTIIYIKLGEVFVGGVLFYFVTVIFVFGCEQQEVQYSSLCYYGFVGMFCWGKNLFGFVQCCILASISSIRAVCVCLVFWYYYYYDQDKQKQEQSTIYLRERKEKRNP